MVCGFVREPLFLFWRYSPFLAVFSSSGGILLVWWRSLNKTLKKMVGGGGGDVRGVGVRWWW
jgi:hypothetical protein